jgi:hypothetical protein
MCRFLLVIRVVRRDKARQGAQHSIVQYLGITRNLGKDLSVRRNMQFNSFFRTRLPGNSETVCHRIDCIDVGQHSRYQLKHRSHLAKPFIVRQDWWQCGRFYLDFLPVERIRSRRVVCNLPRNAESRGTSRGDR